MGSIPNFQVGLKYFAHSEAQPDGETPQIVEAFQGCMARVCMEAWSQLHVVWLNHNFITCLENYVVCILT